MDQNKDQHRRCISLSIIQRQDKDAVDIIESAAHVTCYIYSQDKMKWDKTGVEGPFHIYRRSTEPLYAFIIVNKINVTNLLEYITPTMEFLEQDKVVLYRKRDDKNQNAYGLWFFKPDELKKILTILTAIEKGTFVDPIAAPKLTQIDNPITSNSTNQISVNDLFQPSPRVLIASDLEHKMFFNKPTIQHSSSTDNIVQPTRIIQTNSSLEQNQQSIVNNSGQSHAFHKIPSRQTTSALNQRLNQLSLDQQQTPVSGSIPNTAVPPPQVSVCNDASINITAKQCLDANQYFKTLSPMRLQELMVQEMERNQTLLTTPTTSNSAVPASTSIFESVAETKPILALGDMSNRVYSSMIPQSLMTNSEVPSTTAQQEIQMKFQIIDPSSANDRRIQRQQLTNQSDSMSGISRNYSMIPNIGSPVHTVSDLYSLAGANDRDSDNGLSMGTSRCKIAPLNLEQFSEAFKYALQNDPAFVNLLHVNYLKYLQETIARGRAPSDE